MLSNFGIGGNEVNGTYTGSNAQAFALAKRNLLDLNKNPKMNLAIKGVINSFDTTTTNEGYNNWRGSGDTLYTDAQKEAYLKKQKPFPDSELKRADTKKVYAKIKTQIDHYWEPAWGKYRRHSFYKITYEKL